MGLEILRISEPRLRPGGGNIPLRQIEVALDGKLVNPFEIFESTFRDLDEAAMIALFREYAEGLLETFGEYRRL